MNDKEYFILFAKGKLKNGRISYHENRVASQKKINFQTESNIQTTVVEPAVQELVGEYLNNDFELRWSQSLKSENTLDFVFITKIDSVTANYTAFAFSDDQKMGNDCVCVCRINQDVSISVEHHYNPNKYQRPELIAEDDPSIGITNASVLITDDKMICSFSRLKSIPGNNKYFDLNAPNAFYLLLAKGPIGEMGKFLN